MKSTGIVRRIDELGRIVVPIEMRRALDIGERETMETISSGIVRCFRLWMCTTAS